MAVMTSRDKYQRRYALRPGEESAHKRQGFALRSMSEVAAILGVSRQAVHQVERQALLKIRKALEPYVAR